MTSDTNIKIDFKIYTKINQISLPEKQAIAAFLHTHLGRYGDPQEHILNAIEYAIGDHPFKGGFVVLAKKQDDFVGAVVVNQTHMSGYIPENILVYIAVDIDFRGLGIGKELMQHAIDFSSGDIALHVEPDNPALKLYEKIGFENPYLEMRYKKKK